MEFKKYRIKEIKQFADNVKVFSFEPLDGVCMIFLPGQFAKIYDSEKKVFRSYSITSVQGSKTLEFAIKIVGGEFTKYLDTLQVGVELWIEGPLGHFHYSGEDKAAFVAGGLGITPFISMLRTIRSQKKKGEFVLFYSARTMADFMYLKELKQISETTPNIHIVFTITRETPDNWKGELGRVDQNIIQKYIQNPGDYKWYSCGPLKMVLEVKGMLVGMGVPGDKIKFEGWG